MSYLHIENLYKAKDILLFRRCYALEKVHGTSAHVSFKHEEKQLNFFSGGEKHERFTTLFDAEALATHLESFGQDVVVFGEAYGGSQQGMKATYGSELRFIAFDVKIGDLWLTVPKAEKVVTDLGLEFIPWREVEATIEALTAERDRPSEVAVRRGCGDRLREGIVIRPLIEVRLNNNDRVIAKYKNEPFSERKKEPKVGDTARLTVFADAQAVADEWVVETRLQHVLDKMPEGIGMDQTRDVISAMTEDVLREGAGEIIDSREVRGAIGKRTAQLFKQHLQNRLQSS